MLPQQKETNTGRCFFYLCSQTTGSLAWVRPGLPTCGRWLAHLRTRVKREHDPDSWVPSSSSALLTTLEAALGAHPTSGGDGVLATGVQTQRGAGPSLTTSALAWRRKVRPVQACLGPDFQKISRCYVKRRREMLTLEKAV